MTIECCFYFLNYEVKASGKSKQGIRYVGVLRMEKRIETVIWDHQKVNMPGSKIVFPWIYLRLWKMNYLFTNVKWDPSVPLSPEKKATVSIGASKMVLSNLWNHKMCVCGWERLVRETLREDKNLRYLFEIKVIPICLN